MYLRYFVFLLFLAVTTSNLQSQGAGPDLLTPVNNPFTETVRPTLEYESGRLIFKLVNGFHEAVLLTQVSVSQGSFKSGNLLKQPIDFSPAEIKYLTLDSRRIDLSQKIRLALETSPKPPKQKSEFWFRFQSGTSRIIEVESEPQP